MHFFFQNHAPFLNKHDPLSRTPQPSVGIRMRCYCLFFSHGWCKGGLNESAKTIDQGQPAPSAQADLGRNFFPCPNFQPVKGPVYLNNEIQTFVT